MRAVQQTSYSKTTFFKKILSLDAIVAKKHRVPNYVQAVRPKSSWRGALQSVSVSNKYNSFFVTGSRGKNVRNLIYPYIRGKKAIEPK